MSTNNTLELNARNFDEETSHGLSMVDFWAPWCGPCRMMGPIIDALAGEMEGQLKIAKVNVDENETLAARFGVMTIPSIFIMRDGEVLKQFVGVQSKEMLKNTLLEALSA